jgi:hypothetical protein
MIRKIAITGTMLAAAMALGLAGCSTDGAPTLFPNPDANLHKNSAEFAADAAKRNYESDAPHAGNAEARAQYELTQRRVDLVNLSQDDWSNVEVWVNQKYVVFIPAMQKDVDKKLDFEMFYDRDGHHFDTQGGKNPLQSIEICMDGKVYSVKAVME